MHNNTLRFRKEFVLCKKVNKLDLNYWKIIYNLRSFFFFRFSNISDTRNVKSNYKLEFLFSVKRKYLTEIWISFIQKQSFYWFRQNCYWETKKHTKALRMYAEKHLSLFFSKRKIRKHFILERIESNKEFQIFEISKDLLW